MNDGYQLFWGDSHHNTYQHYRQEPPLYDVLSFAGKHLDFYTGAYYTQVFHVAGLRPGVVVSGQGTQDGHPMEVMAAAGRQWTGVRLERPKDPAILAREWEEFQQITAQWNRPGEFVAFPGYEWQGNGRWGDFNVTYLREGAPCYMDETLPELYARLRRHDAIAIPHHTAYRVGRRAPNWSSVDPELSPYAELYSIHGCSETDEEWIGLRHNPHMGPGVAGGTYQEALDRGLHLGAACSTDNWANMPGQWNQGLMACLAGELTRASLWEAFRARRVYGVTGDRIQLEFTCNGHSMGTVLRSTDRRELYAQVVGAAAVDRIELLRNGRVIATHTHQDTWSLPAAGERTRYKLRIETGWGPQMGEIPMWDLGWQGELEIDGGRIIGWEPCWVSRDQEVPRLEGSRATFRLVSKQTHNALPVQNALIFELDADPAGRLCLKLNGQTLEAPLSDFAARSHLLWYPELSRSLIASSTDTDMTLAEQTDVIYHMSPKAKIHRAVPAAGYCASLHLIDDEPLRGPVHYRVRVEQRNGQRAWSSPIWLEGGDAA